MLESALASFTTAALPSLSTACKPDLTSLSYLMLHVIWRESYGYAERTI